MRKGSHDGAPSRPARDPSGVAITQTLRGDRWRVVVDLADRGQPRELVLLEAANELDAEAMGEASVTALPLGRRAQRRGAAELDRSPAA